MTIAPLSLGRSYYYGPNGLLLSGGKVTSYIPKSTVFKTTWTSPTQATANANPITLDSAGSALLYGFGALRQILQDSSGDTVWDSVTWGGPLTQSVVVLGTSDNGNFVVPRGVYAIYIEVVGGGGAGSNCLAPTNKGDVSGGGGGAGGFANGLYSVKPGQTFPYSVGAGGVFGAQGKGGISSFGTIISCAGGAGSSFSSGGTSVGGLGGTASGGTIMNLPGGSGTDGSHIPPSGGAPYIGSGNGGTSFYGPGGTGANGGSGNSGVAPGSGGGGAMDVNLTNITLNGGAGAVGQILIGYWS